MSASLNPVHRRDHTEPATYTILDVAQLTSSSERHIHRLNDMGKIPGRIRGLGRLVRFSRTAIDQWLAGSKQEGGVR